MKKKSALSEKSQKLIDKVIALLSIPVNQKYYNQSTFKKVSPLDKEHHDEYAYTGNIPHKCQTECCIAGWLVYAKSPELYKNTNIFGIESLAKGLLTLENGEKADVDVLFSGSPNDYWPRRFKRDSKSPDAKVKAQNAIKALKHYKANVTEDGWK
jgi:hypothetical protein